MKSKPIYISLLLFLLLTAPFQQVGAAGKECRLAPTARMILDRVAEQFRRSGGVMLEFVMENEAGEIYKGSLSLKEDKFVLSMNGIKTWFNGHTQWTYLAANDEVNISNPTPEEIQSINPYAWLSLYKQGYELALVDYSPASSTCISMKATDPQADFSKINIVIREDANRPTSIAMFPRGNLAMSIAIRITSYKEERLPDSIFVFDKREYPTAEVVDLR